MFGWWHARRRQKQQGPKRPAGRRQACVPKRLVELYTRRGCHLCDEAKQVLLDAGLEPQEIDIDNDAELQRRYGEQIPVVVIDGKERFRGRVDRLLLDRLLSATDGSR